MNPEERAQFKGIAESMPELRTPRPPRNVPAHLVAVLAVIGLFGGIIAAVALGAWQPAIIGLVSAVGLILIAGIIWRVPD
jgi:hypothetical protein